MLPSPPRATGYVFELLGGHVGLDFANTVSGKRLQEPIERLLSYEDLLSWARQTGVLSEARARRLSAEARRRPAEAAAALRRAIEVREALFRLYRSVAERRDPAPGDLEIVNSALARALAHERLVREGGRYRLAFPEKLAALDSVLWPVLRAAAELLASGDLERVRICEATPVDGCGWLFLDETRSRTRRWCSMRDCGNRAKARRHYRRHKGEA